jgi:ketosteroid isomerase-like protein
MPALNVKHALTAGKNAKGDAMKRSLLSLLQFGSLMTLTSIVASGSSAPDERIVAALDTEYQAAVKNNDAAKMDRILADGFIIVSGSGKTRNKTDLLQVARAGRIHYEHQEDSDQTVRVWGNTAVVTAKLWAKGTDDGKPFEYFVWFSDTYVRTPSGWRYVHGQASLPLPAAPK